MKEAQREICGLVVNMAPRRQAPVVATFSTTQGNRSGRVVSPGPSNRPLEMSVVVSDD